MDNLNVTMDASLTILEPCAFCTNYAHAAIVKTLRNVKHTNDSDSNTMDFTSSPESYKLKESGKLGI